MKRSYADYCEDCREHGGSPMTIEEWELLTEELAQEGK